MFSLGHLIKKGHPLEAATFLSLPDFFDRNHSIPGENRIRALQNET